MARKYQAGSCRNRGKVRHKKFFSKKGPLSRLLKVAQTREEKYRIGVCAIFATFLMRSRTRFNSLFLDTGDKYVRKLPS
jgi:hypothetical protein